MYLMVLGLGVLISACILLYFVRSPAFSLFHPFTIYSAFHFLVFLIRPMFGYWLDYQQLYLAYHFVPSLDDRITVIAAANLGYLAFAFFCLRAGSMAMRFAATPLHLEERHQLSKVFVWVACLCFPVALYSLVNNFGSGGNYDGMVLDLTTGISINTKSNGYITDAQLMLAPLCAIIAWLGRFRAISLLPALGFVLIRGGTGGRGPFVAAMVMVGLLYLYERRWRYPNLRITGFLLVGAAFFSWVGADRGEGLRTMAGFDPVGNVRPVDENAKFMETMDVANMEFFEYIVWVVPQQSGTYDYFLSNLQIFTEPVPRVLWKAKPVGPPIQRVRLFDYGFPIGMTYSLPGAGWYSLGWLGVAIWCGLWGHVTGTVYRKFCQSDQSAIKTVAYFVFIASLVVAFRDGVLLSAIRQLGVYMAPIGIWYLLARFLGTPRLADLARAASDRLARAVAREQQSPANQALAKLRDLPPAVRRRRLALQNLRTEE